MSDVYKKLINRITDNYNRSEDSNISKILKLAASHIQENEELLYQVRDWRDIDNAQGVTLDYIGRNIGQDRMGFDDEVFRVLLKSRIIRNNSDGSIPTILNFLSFILGIEKKFINIKEKWRTGEPVGMHIEVDIDYVISLGISLEQFGFIVNELAVGGTNVDLFYIGSFMFSDYVDQVQEDAEHGFSELVSDEFYYPGDFRFSAINEPPDEQQGFANFEDGRGGKLGGYFKMNGFKDGTKDVLKSW